MRVLALDTSQLQASVCLIEGGTLVASRVGNIAVAHSEAILPLVHELLKERGLSIHDIESYGIGVGPGSFTGIRIGAATVKALAQVQAKPVLPFSSIKALALSAAAKIDTVVAMANAYQGQVFVGWMLDGQWHEDVLSAADWCARYYDGVAARGKVQFCGNGATVYRAAIEKGEVLEQVPFILPMGVTRAISQASPITYAALQANYMRPSQAEVNLLKSTDNNRLL